MGGLAVLGCVHDLTVQYSILGEGLLPSASRQERLSDGHAMALNIADDYRQPRQRVRSTATSHHAAERNPLIGATCTDLIDNVIYNYVEGPGATRTALNVIGNTFRPGRRRPRRGSDTDRRVALRHGRRRLRRP